MERAGSVGRVVRLPAGDQIQDASESEFYEQVEDMMAAAEEGAEVAFYEKGHIARLRAVR